MASTSTSVASSRKRSTSTGRSADRPPSLPRLPKPASCGHGASRGPRRRRRSPWPGRRARSTGAPAPGSRCATAMARASSMSAAVPPAGCGISSRAHSAFQRSRSSARSIDAGDVPTTSSGGSRSDSLSGVWPPSETITPTGSLGLDDVHDVLVGERLEVEAVGRVVVGRHRLGVAVDHDRLEAGVAQGEAGVDAAVVELDALADAVGPGAEDHDLRPVGRARPRRRPRRSSSGTASRPRTRRRRCRRS